MIISENIDKPVAILNSTNEIEQYSLSVFLFFSKEIEGTLMNLIAKPDRLHFFRVEQELQRILQIIGDHLICGILQVLIADLRNSTDFNKYRLSQNLQSNGLRSTPIRFLGGSKFNVCVPYYRVNEKSCCKRKTKIKGGNRGDTSSSRYLFLEFLGIKYNKTSALNSEIAKQSVRCSSFEEASVALYERGIRVSAKDVRLATSKLGNAALEKRAARIKLAHTDSCLSNEFAGKRIMVSVDGGRIRLRKGGDRGRKGKNGHRRYQTPWKEPKLISINVIDDKGKMDKLSLSFYDGTLDDADAVFSLLFSELKLRGAEGAKEIIFSADGATWIWNRVDSLIKKLGISPERVVKVADFYHAVEHLYCIAGHRTDWKVQGQQKWVKTQRKKLLNGKIDHVIANAKGICCGKNAEKIAKEIEYFRERRSFMRYDFFKDHGIPLGSGVIESAVRRVINLRLKSPGMFWRQQNAEYMLHLRSYLKSERWNELIERTLCDSEVDLINDLETAA